MGNLVGQTIDVLDVYEGRDAAITFTLYFCCFLSGFYPRKSAISRTLIRIFKRLESCRVVLRLFDDLSILRDTLTYELKPGERNGIVRVLKCLHYLSWIGFYACEHICWLGEMKVIDIDAGLWDFYTSFFWSAALITSALWNGYVVIQYMAQKKYSKEEEEEKKKSFIPWTAVRDAMLATVRDGSESLVAINCLPKGFLWGSTLTTIQIGGFGVCSAFLRLFALFKFER